MKPLLPLGFLLLCALITTAAQSEESANIREVFLGSDKTSYYLMRMEKLQNDDAGDATVTEKVLFCQRSSTTNKPIETIAALQRKRTKQGYGEPLKTVDEVTSTVSVQSFMNKHHVELSFPQQAPNYYPLLIDHQKLYMFKGRNRVEIMGAQETRALLTETTLGWWSKDWTPDSDGHHFKVSNAYFIGGDTIYIEVQLLAAYGDYAIQCIMPVSYTRYSDAFEKLVKLDISERLERCAQARAARIQYPVHDAAGQYPAHDASGELLTKDVILNRQEIKEITSSFLTKYLELSDYECWYAGWIEFDTSEGKEKIIFATDGCNTYRIDGLGGVTGFFNPKGRLEAIYREMNGLDKPAASKK